MIMTNHIQFFHFFSRAMGVNSLKQALGLCEAAFCATSLLLPDVHSVRATAPPCDGSPNVFEKQDSTPQVDCAVSGPPLKRSCGPLHTPLDLSAPHRRLGQTASKGFAHEMPRSEAQSEQTHALKREKKLFWGTHYPTTAQQRCLVRVLKLVS